MSRRARCVQAQVLRPRERNACAYDAYDVLLYRVAGNRVGVVASLPGGRVSNAISLVPRYGSVSQRSRRTHGFMELGGDQRTR